MRFYCTNKFVNYLFQVRKEIVWRKTPLQSYYILLYFHTFILYFACDVFNWLSVFRTISFALKIPSNLSSGSSSKLSEYNTYLPVVLLFCKDVFSWSFFHSKTKLIRSNWRYAFERL